MGNGFEAIERGASFLDEYATTHTRRDDNAVARALASANSARQDAASTDAVVSLVSAQNVRAEPVRWLWPGWLAGGKLAIIGGAPGCGKTTIALALGAVVSQGGAFPDGSRCAAPGNVLIWSGEDDPGDTLKPRLLAAGANLSRCFFVTTTLDADGSRPFDPAQDMAALDAAADRLGSVRLLIADPIVSAVAGDSHKNAEVRRALQPMVEFAARHGCAVIGITHFTKGTAGRDPVERITGSLAFAALARLVMVAAKERSGEDERRVFVRAKSNIGPDGGGFAYSLDVSEVQADGGTVTTSGVTWGDPIEGEARTILANAERSEDDEDADMGDALTDAVAFLQEVLSCGSVAAGDVKKRARAEGLADRTLARARQRLGVKSERQGFGKGAIWFLPASAPFVPENAIQATQNSAAQMGNDGTNDDAEIVL